MPHLADILQVLGDSVSVSTRLPSPEWPEVRRIADVRVATAGDLAFIRHEGPVGLERALDSEASVLIVPQSLRPLIEASSAGDRAVVIFSANPRLSVALIAERLLPPAYVSGIHPTAVISPDASMGDRVHVGAGCVVGAAVLGDDVVLHPHVTVYDGVQIGARSVIHANSTIGPDGFGYERDEHGVPHKFPQIAGVCIADDVEIGACSCIDRGSLTPTQIGPRTKIDNLVHVAHNVSIGSDCLIAAHAVIAGSTVLGNRVWIGPSATVSNGLYVGDDAVVSLGAVVTQQVPAGERVSGNFAVEHGAFLRHMRGIREPQSNDAS